MPTEPLIYDLVLLLSTSASDDRRAEILAEAESAITGGGGVLERKDAWGMRPLTFRINHQAEAEYHLLQFSGPPLLLETLSHRLKITDGVLRSRIIKVRPGTPPPPDSPPPVIAAVSPRAATPAAAPAVAAPAGAAAGAD